MTAFTIPRLWIDSGVVLGQGPSASSKKDNDLKKKLDEILSDKGLFPKDLTQVEFLDKKPHIFIHKELPNKVIKTARHDKIGEFVVNPGKLNRLRVGEYLKIQKVLREKKLNNLDIPRSALYSRINPITREVHFAVIVDRVNELQKRILSSFFLKKYTVKPLKKEHLVDLLVLFRYKGPIDYFPENIPLHNGKLALLDVEPILQETAKSIQKWWLYVVAPLLVNDIYTMGVMENLHRLKMWNVAKEDRGLVNHEIRRTLLISLAKKITLLTISVFLAFALYCFSPIPFFLLTAASIFFLAQGLLSLSFHLTFIASPNSYHNVSRFLNDNIDKICVHSTE